MWYVMTAFKMKKIGEQLPDAIKKSIQKHAVPYSFNIEGYIFKKGRIPVLIQNIPEEESQMGAS